MADRARASIRAAAQPPAPVAAPAPAAAPAYVPTDTPVLPDPPAWLRAFCGRDGGDFYTAPSVISWAGRRWWVATDGHRLAMVQAHDLAPVNVDASRAVGGVMGGLRAAGEPRAYTVTSEVVYQWGRLLRGEQNEPQLARIDGPAGPVVLDRRHLNGACLALGDDSGPWEWRVRGPADPVTGKGPDGRILVVMSTGVGGDPMGLPALTTAGVTAAPVAIVTVPADLPAPAPVAAPELPPAGPKPRPTPAPRDMVPAPGPVRADDKRTVPCPCPLCRKALPAARNLRAASLGQNARAA